MVEAPGGVTFLRLVATSGLVAAMLGTINQWSAMLAVDYLAFWSLQSLRCDDAVMQRSLVENS